MALKRENVGDHAVLYIRSGGDEEFEAFDQLGPCVQQALRDGPIKSSSIAILGQVNAKNQEIEQNNEVRRRHGMPTLRLLDPKDAVLDMHLARGFLTLNVQNIMKDRSEEDAMRAIKPIESNVGPRSLREQRRWQRQRRWR